MGDGLDGRVVEMIGAAVLAGAYRSLARAEPDAERGLLKMARKHSARAGTLATEISASIGAGTPVRAPLPYTKR
jgi:hypothetical protein